MQSTRRFTVSLVAVAVLAVGLIPGIRATVAADQSVNWALPTTSSVTVNPGDTVTWTWADSLPHTVTSTSGPTSFDSGTLTGSGETFAYTFTEPGTYTYLCNVHPDAMTGTVVVEAVEPDPSPTPTEPAPTATPTESAPAATATPTEPAPPATPTPTEPAPTSTPTESAPAATATPTEPAPPATPTPTEAAPTSTPTESTPAATATPTEAAVAPGPPATGAGESATGGSYRWALGLLAAVGGVSAILLSRRFSWMAR